MIKNRWLSLALWITLPVVACAPPVAEWTDDDRAAVSGMYERYLQALVDNDPAALAALFTVDGVRIPNGSPVNHGREAIQGVSISDDFTSFQIDNTEIGGQGDTAYSWTEYALTSLASGGAEPSTVNNRSLLVIRRQPDGSWLITTMMFNTRILPTGS